MRKLSLRSLSLAICLAGLAGCGNVICDEGHSSVAMARSVSRKDWAQLFSEAETIARARPPIYENTPVKTPLPQFDLSPLAFVRHTDDQASVKLAGCFDHGVYLSLEELNTPQGRIELSWGEGPSSGSQVVWSRRSAP